ncbi:MAG TPA: bacteriohemerythrin [Aromatoleum sp.]|uniref:bacteriohemerythrin n=1 Tax=Aromatoleum sp. TaxID=2307007 RepID=UPI002B481C07|nr:bacteriohemerythrin [Aromatoleum sp.]HJV28376.1 bacteriohemerythrin [Aromatoleum sp.]
MDRFEWKAEYSVDDATLDAQHQEMIAIINELADQLRRPDVSATAARDVFDRLAAYVTSHFSYEEGRIADAGYPLESIAAHRAEHNKILRQVQDFEQLFESGDVAVLQQLMPFLYGEWLILHICGTDKDYVPYITGAH